MIRYTILFSTAYVFNIYIFSKLSSSKYFVCGAWHLYLFQNGKFFLTTSVNINYIRFLEEGA